jgi:hypothetical protein
MSDTELRSWAILILLVIALVGLIIGMKRADRFASEHGIPRIYPIIVQVVLGVFFISRGVVEALNLRAPVPDAEVALTRFCGTAGETIERTVRNVDGFFMQVPAAKGDLHEPDSLPASFLVQPDTPYSFFELGEYATEARPIVRYTGREDEQGTQVGSSRSKYAVTWTTARGQNGMSIDITVVFDVRTQQVLAQRKTFYYVERKAGAVRSNIRTCDQLRDGFRSSSAGMPLRDLSSYSFISRVLIPRPMSERGVLPAPGVDIERERLERSRQQLIAARAAREAAEKVQKAGVSPEPSGIKRSVDANGVVSYSDGRTAPSN